MYAGFDSQSQGRADIEGARPLNGLASLARYGRRQKIQVVWPKACYTKEEMEGKSVVVVSNLKPAKLRANVQGMLLAAEEGDIVSSSRRPATPSPAAGRQRPEAVGPRDRVQDFQKLILRVAGYPAISWTDARPRQGRGRPERQEGHRVHALGGRRRGPGPLHRQGTGHGR